MSSESETEDLQELLAIPGLYQQVQSERKPIYIKDALLSNFSLLRKKLGWIERLDTIVSPASFKSSQTTESLEIDPNDDFRREAYFQQLAQAGVLVVLPKLAQLGVPTKRPDDYFAEMVKSDNHMTKIRKRLIVTEKRLELRDRARQLREGRKFGKQMQLQVVQARRDERKRLNEAVKSARAHGKGKNQANTLDNLLDEFTSDDIPPSNRQKKREFNKPQDLVNRRKINHNRVHKNIKYSHGGIKKRMKRNTFESSMFSRGREFDPSIHQSTSAAHAASIKRRIKAGGAGKGRGGRKGGRSAIRRGPKARRAQRHQKDQARRR